ncbi:MAG: hypothetical protein NTY53_19095 [Kiritimatiellaeota bacterium]|nr:hypothetical protein [Kiritimatiellota bacterium]
MLVRAEHGGIVATLWNGDADAARLQSACTEIAAAVASGRALLAAALTRERWFTRVPSA